MSKNYMADVAKMLGVKLGEPFPLVCSNQKHKLTEEGLWSLDKDGDWVRADSCVFLNLIRGDTVIVAKPYTPKVGEKYYSLAEGHNYYKAEKHKWRGEIQDITRYLAGNCFKSRQEAFDSLEEPVRFQDYLRAEYRKKAELKGDEGWAEALSNF